MDGAHSMCHPCTVLLDRARASARLAAPPIGSDSARTCPHAGRCRSVSHRTAIVSFYRSVSVYRMLCGCEGACVDALNACVRCATVMKMKRTEVCDSGAFLETSDHAKCDGLPSCSRGLLRGCAPSGLDGRTSGAHEPKDKSYMKNYDKWRELLNTKKHKQRSKVQKRRGARRTIDLGTN
eukprot:1911617-Pleurochrysis_carterae.AAC.2